MSYKTDRLIDLFPEVYAARERESLLYKLLNAVGAELIAADESIKQLLKSHWVDYAGGQALDGLATIYGVGRRRLRDGSLESDEAFRRRLKSIVPLFIGGGTKRAVIGAVRSALGLPFDLDQLNLPPGFEALRQDIEALIRLEEFSPKGERVINKMVTEVDEASELRLILDIESVGEGRPTVLWKFTVGGGHILSLERLPDEDNPDPAGVKSIESLIIPAGETLTLSAQPDGRLNAVLGLVDLSAQFTNLDGKTPAILPEVPGQHSEWRFRAQSGLFDISSFDDDNSFDLPLFEVEMSWLRYEPLTFDVHVPYFLQKAVADLAALYNYTGKLFVFEGLPLEAIVQVVNQTRAAGVRARVQFSLNFLEVHDQHEQLLFQGLYALQEDAAGHDVLVVSSVNEASEQHDVSEMLIIGGVFDVSPFDQGHGFSE